MRLCLDGLRSRGRLGLLARAPRPPGDRWRATAGAAIRSVLPEVAFAEARPESYEAIQPDAPADKPLNYLAYVPEAETMVFVYSTTEVDAKSSLASVLGGGGIVAVVNPVGELTAEEIYSNTDRNHWMLEIGDHEAALIWGDEVAEGVRPWGLYWNDETRYWFVRGGQDRPEELVDFARAIYCG